MLPWRRIVIKIGYLSILYLFAVTLFVFLATPTRTHVIASYALFATNWTLRAVFTATACRRGLTFYNLLTLKVAFYSSLHNVLGYFFLNRLSHHLEHFEAFKLIFAKRICTAICTKVDTLTQMIHSIDMIHPLRVYSA